MFRQEEEIKDSLISRDVRKEVNRRRVESSTGSSAFAEDREPAGTGLRNRGPDRPPDAEHIPRSILASKSCEIREDNVKSTCKSRYLDKVLRRCAQVCIGVVDRGTPGLLSVPTACPSPDSQRIAFLGKRSRSPSASKRDGDWQLPWGNSVFILPSCPSRCPHSQCGYVSR